MSSPPQPLLTGHLRTTPLPEFLIQAYDGGFEGSLLLQTPDKQKSVIWFNRGAPAKARLHEQLLTLSEVVVDLGLVADEAAHSSQRQAEAERRLHGTVLLERGYVDQTGLYVALREQLVRQTLLLCGLPDTTGFGFYRENFLERWGHEGQWRVKPLRILWRATVDRLPKERRMAWLAKLGETPLRLRQQAPVSRYGLTKQEAVVVDMLRVREGTLSQLTESGVGDPELVGAIVCGLFLTRQLDLGFHEDPVGLHEPPETAQSLAPPETRVARRSVTVPRSSTLPSQWEGDSSAERSIPPSSSRSHGPTTPSRSLTPNARHSTPARFATSTAPGAELNGAPPSSGRGAQRAAMSPATLAFQAELQKYQDEPPQNYYEVLGLERNADMTQVRSAFFQLARRFHPDKLPVELSHFRAIVTRAFAEMGEAHQVLIDEARRAEYDQRLNSTPSDEQVQVASILRGAGAHQRAEILYKKKAYAEALAEAKVAYDIDSTQPDHVALYAWLHTLIHPEEDHRPQIEMMTKVLESNPDHIRTLWYRGQLYKRMQQTTKAMRDFTHIVNLKPSHVDAAREVRVHRMRRQTDPKEAPHSPKPGGGLFGAFRKK